MKMEQFLTKSFTYLKLLNKKHKQKVLFLPSFCQRKYPFQVIQEQLSTPRQYPLLQLQWLVWSKTPITSQKYNCNLSRSSSSAFVNHNHSLSRHQYAKTRNLKLKQLNFYLFVISTYSCIVNFPLVYMFYIY